MANKRFHVYVPVPSTVIFWCLFFIRLLLRLRRGQGKLRAAAALDQRPVSIPRNASTHCLTQMTQTTQRLTVHKRVVYATHARDPTAKRQRNKCH